MLIIEKRPMGMWKSHWACYSLCSDATGRDMGRRLRNRVNIFLLLIKLDKEAHKPQIIEMRNFKKGRITVDEAMLMQWTSVSFLHPSEIKSLLYDWLNNYLNKCEKSFEILCLCGFTARI